MSEWFTKNLPEKTKEYKEKIYDDFRRFDGNSQTFRLVTITFYLLPTFGSILG